MFGAAEAGWGLDMYTLRTAATRYGRRATPLGDDQRSALLRPHAELMAEATLDPLATPMVADLEIAVLCRPRELTTCVGWADAWLKRGWDVLIVVDEEADRADDVDCSRRSGNGSLRIRRRALDGDFAAQRNFAQAGARRSWVLQLDADETLDDRLSDALSGLIAMAERDDVLSIGFSRRNLVDGVLSDFYPDIQYRLNRACVRFGGKVHERPMLQGGWAQSFIALTGAIEHHLSAEHVAARSLRYETLSPGKGRLDEARRLMEPYRP